MIIAFTAFSSFALSAVFVSLVLYVSRKQSWFDHHNERKIHTGQVPRLGGIGFAVAFLIVSTFLIAKNEDTSLGAQFLPVLFAIPLILTFGIVDDFSPLSPRLKLFAQSVAATIVIIAGFSIRRIEFIPFNYSLELGFFGYPLTFFWIVGITNALNFIDGVDGLAGGVSALAALGYAAVFAVEDDMTAATISVALAAALGGFLLFNLPLPKARIFMGDGGSQFLGFTLALIPLIGNGVKQTILPLPYAAAMLLIPIFDTFAAVWRRIRDGRRIDSPDMAHMHHKLINLGLHSGGVDVVLWSLQIALAAAVFLSRINTGLGSFLLLSSAYAIALLFFTVIHYLNRGAVASGVIKVESLYQEIKETEHFNPKKSV